MGYPVKARAILGWNPSTTYLEELVTIMVDYDMAKIATEKASEHMLCMILANY